MKSAAAYYELLNKSSGVSPKRISPNLVLPNKIKKKKRYFRANMKSPLNGSELVIQSNKPKPITLIQVS